MSSEDRTEAPPPGPPERAAGDGADHSPAGDGDAASAEDALRLLLAFKDQALALGESLARLVAAQSKLACFLAKEHTRLALGRLWLNIVATGAALVAWAFANVFLWRLIDTYCPVPYAPPLAIAFTHAVAALLLDRAARRHRL